MFIGLITDFKLLTRFLLPIGVKCPIIDGNHDMPSTAKLGRKRTRMVKSRSRDLGKLIIRLPEGMREMIDDAIKESERTITDEVVARLGWSFEEEKRSLQSKASFREYAGRSALAQMEAEIKNLEKELGELRAKIGSTKSKFAATRLLKL